MKDKIIVCLFMFYIVIFMLFHISFKDKEISETERRKLSTFPKIELTNKYITKLDKYLLDHFPFRDNFRSVKATYNYNIMNKYDNNDIYLKDNYIYKSDYPTNNKSIQNFKETIKYLSDLFSESNKYIMIIPDKNYYLESDNFLHIDYDYIYDEIRKLNMEQIDIRNLLNINDYYQTDTHWKQENILKVVYKMSNELDFKYKPLNYNKNSIDNFYGVYYGESAIKRNAEKLTYLSNDITENADVYYLENPNLNEIYNSSKLSGLDPYEVYLDGASSYIEIYNKDISNDKEIIIFRDSFGSSLIPLLIPYYSKITVVDNRYIKSDNFMNMIENKDVDVLFMYSTLIVNNSFTLKK